MLAGGSKAARTRRKAPVRSGSDTAQSAARRFRRCRVQPRAASPHGRCGRFRSRPLAPRRDCRRGAIRRPRGSRLVQRQLCWASSSGSRGVPRSLRRPTILHDTSQACQYRKVIRLSFSSAMPSWQTLPAVDAIGQYSTKCTAAKKIAIQLAGGRGASAIA